MHVATTLGNGENILLIIGKLNLNIVLLDLDLRSQNSLQVVKSVKQNFQVTKIIVMDLILLQTYFFEFLHARVSGFMLKYISVTEFLKTIRSVYIGAKILPSHITDSLFSQIVEQAVSGSKTSILTGSTRMTKRERQVIELIADCKICQSI